MTDAQYVPIQGMIAAQSYLIEALLLLQCMAADDPSAAAEKLCKMLAQQIRSDYSANLSLFPESASNETVAASAIEYVETMRERLLGMIENESPMSSGLH